ncbi:MAG: glutamate--cysteine ligase [Magnetococcales bacterium]|nr:glutamate--cysteine ligase [Magnetococcales bacterium]NGZ25866.1 glutamate--cysteine ligase [Magnetococcales bacterium]
MSGALPDDPQPVEGVEQLASWLEAGCKPRPQWRVGTEHEKFGFRWRDLSPLAYDDPDGIRIILERMADRFGWQIILENNLPVALSQGDASVTLEPGGQLELSGAPMETIHQTHEEINTHLSQLSTVCRELDVAFLGIGVQPKWPLESIPWMPKGRYGVMREYLPTRGQLALDMMTRTGTVQANLDFASEKDMVSKFRLSMALQPLVTALFANSPFINGRPTGFLSFRAEIWRHTDPDRCGWLPFIFQDGFGFERYVQYALDVPMFFIQRQGNYLAANGMTFRQFMAGNWPGERPTMGDWGLHLSTLFPDVRLKRFLEMRGADVGNSRNICALPAFWKGILYDNDAMAEAWDLVRKWSLEERQRIHRQVPRRGLATRLPNGKNMQWLAKKILEIARASLHRQKRCNAKGCDESIYLNSLMTVAEKGITPAQRMLKNYHGRWQGSVENVFSEHKIDSFIAECRGSGETEQPSQEEENEPSES